MSNKAFISYSHAADVDLAPAVQAALHRFGKPWYKLRAIRVFRDKTSLAASPGLWRSIETALSDSEYFLFMASERAAASPWVQKELEWWLRSRVALKIFVLLTGGAIVWDARTHDFDWSQTTALPQLLAGKFTEEPLYVDLRWPHRRTA